MSEDEIKPIHYMDKNPKFIGSTICSKYCHEQFDLLIGLKYVHFHYLIK